ncbi:ion channel castor [Quercus suber]|uniref:Ion channel castor n=1 Tax=Quercus suber TaxID=58331 RepID=A0AAW0JTY1_QUESU
MSLDSDSLPPSTSSDWFFPTPPKYPKYPRRFTANPRSSFPYCPPPPPPKSPSFRDVSETAPTPYRDFKYARTRRRVEVSQRSQRNKVSDEANGAVSGPKTEVSGVSAKIEDVSAVKKVSKIIGVSVRDLKNRWHMAVSVAVLITVFSSLLHKNFSLQNQINELQDQISKCNISIGATNSIEQEIDSIPSTNLKILALILSLTLLSIPFLIFEYVDYVSKSRSLDNITEEVSLNKQLAYRVDLFLSAHPYAKPLALLVATLLLICLGGLALYGVTDGSLAECLWLSWTYVADSGNHADSEGIGWKLVSVSISFGGMLIFAMMLGLVSDAISEKLDSLRKGRSEVVEKSHTLILGWSDKLVSVSKARAIIVLAEDGNADQSDACALRTVLSLTGVKGGLRGHVVVELSDLDNEVLVKLVGGDLVQTVVAHDVIGRLMIQCARQPGLAQIWEDILGFENCEFYIKRWPQLDGMQFEDVLISFPDAIPCGVKVASYGGKIVLNPEDSYVLQEGDEVLVIAEDDDTYSPAALPTVWRGSLPKDFFVPKSTEKILLCGWRRDMEDMIMVLDAFLAPGSELWMFNDVLGKEREKKLIDGGLDINLLVNISLVHCEGNAVMQRHLESLPLQSFDSILILADESVEDSAIQADSRSLATLLLIRDIQAVSLKFDLLMELSEPY